jgi:hypothetical protein
MFEGVTALYQLAVAFLTRGTSIAIKDVGYKQGVKDTEPRCWISRTLSPQLQLSRVVVRYRSVAFKGRKVGSMKKQILWMPLILMAMFALAAVSTRAQTAYGVRGNVPFDFIVGDKTIPAGLITAHGVSDAVGGVISIRSLDHGKQAMRAGRRLPGGDETDQCKLVFHRYGNRYFLAQIWIAGYQAWEVKKSKQERSLERELRLVKNFKPEVVTLAAEME